MKTTDIQKTVLAGKVLLVGEYRSGKAEEISYRSKQDGKSVQAIVTRHMVECGTETVAVAEFNPKGIASVTDFKQPFAKGTRVVVHVSRLEVNRGAITVDGNMEPLTE